MGSKDQEKACLGDTGEALVNAGSTVRQVQAGGNVCLCCMYSSICCLKMQLGIKI